MKAIQVNLDEQLLAQLDADEEVRRDGRSAVLRRAVATYLRSKRAKDIAQRYREGYGETSGPPAELEGWSAEGTWPQD